MSIKNDSLYLKDICQLSLGKSKEAYRLIEKLDQMVATYKCLKISHRGMDRFPAFCYICKHKQRKINLQERIEYLCSNLGLSF